MSEDENRALFASAIAHHQAGRSAEAMQDYQALLARNPGVVAAHNNLGMLLDAAGEYLQAEQCFRAALALRPSHTGALNNLGAVLRALRKIDEAVACLRQALVLEPDNVEALINLANTLRDLQAFDEADALYQRAQRLRPDDLRIAKGYGRLRAEREDVAGAIAALGAVARLMPQDAALRAEVMAHRQSACDWTAFEKEERAVLDSISESGQALSPFAVAMLNSTPEEQFNAATKYAASNGLNRTPYLTPGTRTAKVRPRIAYLSSDFREHPVAVFMKDLLDVHDRSKFEIFGYSSGPESESAARKDVAALCDRFVDVQALSDRAAAQRIADDDIDILVDVSGYTKFGRPLILAFKPAPILVNYLANPGTLGMDAVDYIISDETVAPPSHAPFYSEKIVRLPGSYLFVAGVRDVAATPSRSACGLPDDAFVFCSFNRSHKITPTFFAIWMRLLRAVPGSVLWLSATNPPAVENLRRAATVHGIDAARIVFAPPLPMADHLARHRVADLFLDTLPYNAHTTTVDALEADLPVITCIGENFVGRGCASLLRAAGLAELVTDTAAAYEALALRLAQSPDELAAVRRKLRDNKKTAALFDRERYTRGLEAAYTRMIALHRAGQAPQSFSV